MPQSLWINLPVQDVQRSRTFFEQIGFPLNPRHRETPDMASLLIGKQQVVVMLFPESTFRSFTGLPVPDSKAASQVLLSVDAESREAVDALLDAVEAAGGTVCSRPHGDGWMYGGVFADPDGHRWNVLYMDPDRMPGG